MLRILVKFKGRDLPIWKTSLSIPLILLKPSRSQKNENLLSLVLLDLKSKTTWHIVFGDLRNFWWSIQSCFSRFMLRRGETSVSLEVDADHYAGQSNKHTPGFSKLDESFRWSCLKDINLAHEPPILTGRLVWKMVYGERKRQFASIYGRKRCLKAKYNFEG